MLKVFLFSLLVFLFVQTTPAQFDTYELITEYETECYADSSEGEEHIAADGRSCVGISYGWGDFICQSPSHYNKLVWVRRQPDWDGFREFVKKKYQKLLGVPK